MAEVDVVYLLQVSLVQILAGKQLTQGRLLGEEIKLLKNPEELVLGNVGAACFVEVLERWLEHDSVCEDEEPYFLECFNKSALFLL